LKIARQFNSASILPMVCSIKAEQNKVPRRYELSTAKIGPFSCRFDIITHDDGSRVGRVLSSVYVSVCVFVCLSVCLSVFPRDISKTDAPRITKLDIGSPP